jgi:NAD(P)-dependent dehydrogenase (short-subunit alcohol dehydrogenase family)
MPPISSSLGHVFITGSSTGIGRACALHLARVGFTVIAGVRKEMDAGALMEAAGATANLRTVLVDVADEKSVASAGKVVESTVGDAGLLGLVNNAGIGVFGPVEFVTLADWRRQFEVNVFGQIAVTQTCLSLLRKYASRCGMGSARIVNIGSIAGRVGQPLLAPYCASKHAMEAISDAMRLELKGQGIQTSLIEPGAIQSDIWRKAEEEVSTIPADDPSQKLYGTMIRAVGETAKKSGANAIPAQRVAELVERCLTKAKAPTRILVGRDAKIAAFFRRVLPDRMFDWVLGRAIGLK